MKAERKGVIKEIGELDLKIARLNHKIKELKDKR